MALLRQFQEFLHDLVLLFPGLLQVGGELGDDAITLLQGSLKVLELEERHTRGNKSQQKEERGMEVGKKNYIQKKKNSNSARGSLSFGRAMKKEKQLNGWIKPFKILTVFYTNYSRSPKYF